jgi:hypothetical protein
MLEKSSKTSHFLIYANNTPDTAPGRRRVEFRDFCPRSLSRFRLVAYITLANGTCRLSGRLVMNIAGFPSLDEAEERLPRETAALDIERVARANSIKNAIAITAMEGGSPSAFCLDLLSLYETGEISGAEMRKRMLEKARS